PRTEEGKARSSQNSLKDGFYSKSLVILPGLEPKFEQLREQLLDSLKPGGGIQDVLFEEILAASWNLIRAQIAEVQVYERQDDPNIDPLVDDKNEAKLKRIRQFYRSNYTARETAITRLSEVQTEIRARLQAFPPEEKSEVPIKSQAPHSLSALCRLQEVVKAMKQAQAYKSASIDPTKNVKNEPKPDVNSEIEALLSLSKTANQTKS
ncbi:MAG: hypothetical protein HY820_06065, partial [Acidobacteria bacterium]|nr:hypothetical protein [Acidobacteriota bacterium]